MRLSDARRDKISGIWEKTGLVLFLGGGGDLILRASSLTDILLDIVGIASGIALLLLSVMIIRK